MIRVFGVPVVETVPREVAWFWAAVEVGEVPFLAEEDDTVFAGTFTAAPGDTPFICPDLEHRVMFAVELIREARRA